MSEVVATKGDQYPKKPFLLFVSIFFISSNIISLQILLQRFLSVVLTYHFVFIVVSLALFGLSLGGLFAFLSKNILEKYDSINILIFVSYLFYVFVSVCYIFSIYIYNESTLQKDIFIYSGIFIFPFIAGGFYSARLFSSFPEICGQLYGTDLIGAACGCIGIFYLFNRLGLTHTWFLTTFIPLIILSACIIRRGLAEGRRNGFYLGLGALAVLAFLASFLVLKLPDISSGQNPQKEIFDALHTFKGQILQSKDSALGRVDLVGFTDYPHLMDIYVDGTAGMPMYRFNGQFGSPNPAVEELKREFPGYFPLQVLKAAARDEALIIGPGGGRDILLAKMAGFQKITAVEVNPEIVRVVKEHSDFNGKIYAQEDVNLTIGEGRSFLRAHSHRYDMIMFSLPVTNTSQGLGSYALTENYLYTTEAISEYLENLSDQGALVFITHNDLELLRLLAMTLSSFQEKNIATAEAMQYLFVVGSADYPVLVVKKQKIPLNESQEILKAAFNQAWFLPGSSFFPQVGSPLLNKMLLGMESSQVTAEDLVREGDKRGYDIRPVSDLSPFFYKLDNFLPSSLKNVFYFSIAAVVVFLSFPCMSILYKNRKKKHSDKLNTKIYIFFGVYFAMIGAGFMIFEVTMIQRFMLVLGNPVFSMSTIIFTILVGAGLGSLASSRMHVHRLPKGMILACGMIACLILVYQTGLSSMLYFLSTGSMFFKALLTFVFLGPLGFVMGFPLPVAIRLIKLFNMSGMIPWMLAINGASSVLGSALTVVLAMVYGYGTALLAAAICYGIVSVSSYLIAKEARPGFFNSSEISFDPAHLGRTTSMNQSSQKGSPRK